MSFPFRPNDARAVSTDATALPLPRIIRIRHCWQEDRDMRDDSARLMRSAQSELQTEMPRKRPYKFLN